MNGIKGVLMKDLALIKNQLLIVIFIIAIYSASMLILDNKSDYLSGFAGSYSVVIMSMMPVTLLAYDEKNKWGIYSAAMPVSRKANVVSKYIIMLGLSILNAAIIGMIFLVSGNGDMLSFLTAIAAVSILTGSIVTVLAYKFGSNNARFIFIACIFIFFIAAFWAAGAISTIFGSSFQAGSYTVNIILSVFLLISILICLASMMASIHIYEKKDF